MLKGQGKNKTYNAVLSGKNLHHSAILGHNHNDEHIQRSQEGCPHSAKGKSELHSLPREVTVEVADVAKERRCNTATQVYNIVHTKQEQKRSPIIFIIAVQQSAAAPHGEAGIRVRHGGGQCHS